MKRLFLFSVKKKRFWAWTLCLLLLFLLLIISICAEDITPAYYRLAQDSLSEYRKNFYFATCDNFSVTFTTGKREEPFVYDGKREKMVEYGVVTVKFKNMVDETPKFVLIIDSWQYSGSFELNPFDGTYVADIQQETKISSDIFVRVFTSSMSKSMPLICESDKWKIDYKKALKIATTEFTEELKNYYNNRNFLMETYIKIVSESIHSTENTFWYIYFLSKNGDSLICLINPYSGEIVAKKANLIA